MKRTKRRLAIIGGVALGLLALAALLLVLGGPLAVRMGLETVCIQGDWPHVKIVSCAGAPAAAAVVTPWPLPTANRETPIPAIVDDDGSPDGVIALLFLLRNPRFDVKAVTVSYGEAHPEVFAGHMRQLLAGLGRSDIPVGAGRDAPLAGNNAFPEPWRQASDTFWGISLPGAPVPGQAAPAAELIVQTLRASREPMVVFVTGAQTNLAEALRLDPNIAGQIRDVYIMGGSIYAGGNIHRDWPDIENEVAEWNIWVDPLAADEVVESGLPLHLFPLDSSGQVIWTEADAAQWASSGSAEGVLAAEMLRMALRTLGRDGGMYVWDLIAAEAATDARLCPEQPLSLDVITATGPEQGQTALGDGAPNAGVCLAANAEQLRARAAATLGSSTEGEMPTNMEMGK